MNRVTDTREKWMSFNEDLDTYDGLFLFHRKMYRILFNRLRVIFRKFKNLSDRHMMCCKATYRWQEIVENMVKQMQGLGTALNRERMSVSLLLDKFETMGVNTEDLAKIVRETVVKAVTPTTKEDVLARKF